MTLSTPPIYQTPPPFSDNSPVQQDISSPLYTIDTFFSPSGSPQVSPVREYISCTHINYNRLNFI
jgi:hypothetical protein